MTESGDARQAYAFSCTECGHCWQEARLPAAPVCPFCDSRKVHAVPDGLVERARAAEAVRPERSERHRHASHLPHGPHRHLWSRRRGGADPPDGDTPA